MSERAKIEETGESNGLDYAVLAMDMGHRCGYVRVPEDHPWFGRDYTDEAEGPVRLCDWSETIEAQVEVHGGLTFSGKHSELEEGWWFGFDCAHLGDRPDPELQSAEYRTIDIFDREDTIRDLPYVRAECGRLAEQLAEAPGE